MISHMPQSWCPSCRKSLNTAGSTPVTAPEKARPVEGDLTVCANCDAVLQFSAGMQLRELTDAELGGLSVEELEGIAAAQVITRRVRAGRPS